MCNTHQASKSVSAWIGSCGRHCQAHGCNLGNQYSTADQRQQQCKLLARSYSDVERLKCNVKCMVVDCAPLHALCSALT